MAVAVAVVAAGAATLVLRPRSGLIEPATVDPTAYFSAAELRRAEDFRDLQRLIGVGGLLVSGATLGVLALRPPRGIRRLLDRAEAHPLRGAAVAGAGISLALAVTGLPLSLWAHERAVDVGLSTQSLGPWLGDAAKSSGIGAVVAAAGGAIGIALIRRCPRRWWLPGSGVVVAFAVLVLYLSPVVVDPLFNEFEPLPRGQLRTDVLRLADRAGVDVGEVFRIDASRRTTAINAYVGGLGQTKRVVLYDNLIEDFPADQVRSVVAHELGHVQRRDLLRGLLWIAIVAPAGMLVVQRLTEWIGAREGNERRSGQWLGPGSGQRLGPAAVPALALSLALVSFALTSTANAVSRPVEAHADSFALELTDDPEAFIALERSLALRNLGDPQPPAIFQALFGTHPTTVERIGFGEAFARRRDAGAPP